MCFSVKSYEISCLIMPRYNSIYCHNSKMQHLWEMLICCQCWPPNAGPYVSLLGRTERTKILSTALKFPTGNIHDRSVLLLHPPFAPNLGFGENFKYWIALQIGLQVLACICREGQGFSHFCQRKRQLCRKEIKVKIPVNKGMQVWLSLLCVNLQAVWFCLRNCDKVHYVNACPCHENETDHFTTYRHSNFESRIKYNKKKYLCPRIQGRNKQRFQLHK